MSLFRQIQVVITVLLLTVLTVVMKIYFDNTQEFIVNQLYNNAKNTSAVLALSPGLRFEDKNFLTSGIDAIYDSGLYEEIKLTDINSKVVYQRNDRMTIDGVPRFFIDFIDLRVPVAESQVKIGWSVMGTVYVKAYSGTSYVRLWEIVKNFCILFVFLGSATIVTGSFILRLFFKSLTKIQLQAEAICNNEFIVIGSVPKTPELKKVVLAMNTMVKKVQGIYNRQLEYLKDYRNLMFRDINTELHNRKFLIKQLGGFLEGDNEKARGQLLILSLSGMENTNISVFHPVLCAFFKDLGAMLKSETSIISDSVTAQLPGHEYAVVLPNCSEKEGAVIANALMKRILELPDGNSNIIGVVSAHIGIAAYGHDDNLKTILSKADYALSVAKSGRMGMIVAFEDEDGRAVLGKFEWRTMIEDSLAQNRFVLSSQSVLSDDGELHKEIYINMPDTHGVVQKAGYFMPMAITLGLAKKIDQYVLEKTAKYLEKNLTHIVSVNISTGFCIDRVSLIWFRQFLNTRRYLKNNLVFELHESTLIQYPEICLDIAGLLKGMNYAFGIDQFTLNESALDLLKKLNPDYIKVDHGYLYDAENVINTELALNALITITESLDIKLIAAKIENNEQRKMLSEKNIDYFQGSGVSEITPLTT